MKPTSRKSFSDNDLWCNRPALEPKSVKKKLKDKAFAAKVDREIIRSSVELLGVDMDSHIQFVIDVLKPHAQEFGIAGRT